MSLGPAEGDRVQFKAKESFILGLKNRAAGSPALESTLSGQIVGGAAL